MKIEKRYIKVILLEGDAMFFRKKRFFICPVFGYDRLPRPLYEKGIPDVSLICACCGFQPGYDDEELGYTMASFRKEWIQNGAKWFREKEKPKQWGIEEQLKNINIK